MEPGATAASRRIFISYRRDDAAAHAGRLHDRLVLQYGTANVFMDIDTIQPGDDFVEAIAGAVASCGVLLALIGPDWLTSADDSGRSRLLDPDDFVRIELESALKRSVRVIPLLVGDARMPARDELPEALHGLARRQAFPLSEQRWNRDVAELIERLGGPATAPQPVVPPVPRPLLSVGPDDDRPVDAGDAEPVDTAPVADPPAARRRPVAAIALAAAGVLLLALAAVLALGTGRPAGEPPIPVGRTPTGITSGGGYVWVANRGDGSVSRIDPTDGSVRSIRVGGKPVDLRVGDDGGVWVWNYTASVTRIDMAELTVGPPVASSGGPITGFAVGGGHLWLTHGPTGTVSRINIATRTADGPPIKLGDRLGGTTFADGRLVVLDRAQRSLIVVDGGSGRPLSEPRPLPGPPGGVQVHGSYICVGTATGITRVDATTFVVDDPLPLSRAGLFDVGDGVLWVSYPFEDTVRRFDLDTLEPVGQPVTGIGRGLTQSTFAAGQFWATREQSDDVVRIRADAG